MREFARRQPFAILSLAALAGILLGDRRPDAWLGYAIAAAFLSLPSAFRPHRWLTTTLLVAVCGLVFAFVQACLLKGYESFPAMHDLHRDERGLHVELTGEVADAPKNAYHGSYQFPIRLTKIRLNDRWIASRHRVLVHLAREAAPPCGSRVHLSGNLRMPSPPRNPGQFDYGNHLKRKNIVGVLTVGRSDMSEVLASPRGRRLKRLAISTREWMAAQLTRDLESEPAISRVITAMTLGMRDETPPEIEDAFRLSGTLHIFAVSGLHVGIFALIIWSILKPFGMSRARTALILIPCLFFYAYITGWRPSAVRAATMASVFLGGFVFQRTPRLLNSLGLAAMLLLAWDSNQLFLPGFQLSFAVLLAIAILTARLQRPFRSFVRPDPFVPAMLVSREIAFYHRSLRRVMDLVTVSTAAWLGSMPFMLIYFQIITPVAIVANGLLITLGYFILFAAALSLLAAAVPFLGFIGVLFNNANFGLVSLLIGAAQWFAALPGAHSTVPTRPHWLRSPCEITVLDLPNGGGAQHVWFRQSGDFFIDCGHARVENAVLDPYSRYTGLRRLESLFITHADAAHISAAPRWLGEFQPSVLYEPIHRGRGASMRSVVRAVEIQGIELRPLSAGDTLDIPGARNAFWEVLYPPSEDAFLPGEADDRALVLRLHFKGWRVLLVSDAGFFTERWLLETGADLRSDILIKGSRADDLDGLIEFIQAVDPGLIVADAANASDRSWREWAKKNGVTVFDQRLTGAVRIGLSPLQCRARAHLGSQTFFLKRAR